MSARSDPDVRVTDATISAAEAADRVRRDRAGAIATFEGTVRDHHENKEVAFLEYEAYVPMARAELERLTREALERWPVEAIALDHRIGRLEIGQVAVAIAVSAAHRGPAFDALRWLIDTLKTTVPIWKRETGPDGSWWIEGPDHVRARE